jgi:hypothetical protein
VREDDDSYLATFRLADALLRHVIERMTSEEHLGWP